MPSFVLDRLPELVSNQERGKSHGKFVFPLQTQAEGELLVSGGVMKNSELVEEVRAGKHVFLAKYRPMMESNETPINPYRVIGDLMKVLDPKAPFVTADSGNTRDQTANEECEPKCRTDFDVHEILRIGHRNG